MRLFHDQNNNINASFVKDTSRLFYDIEERLLKDITRQHLMANYVSYRQHINTILQ